MKKAAKYKLPLLDSMTISWWCIPEKRSQERIRILHRFLENLMPDSIKKFRLNAGYEVNDHLNKMCMPEVFITATSSVFLKVTSQVTLDGLYISMNTFKTVIERSWKVPMVILPWCWVYDIDHSFELDANIPFKIRYFSIDATFFCGDEKIPLRRSCLMLLNAMSKTNLKNSLGRFWYREIGSRSTESDEEYIRSCLKDLGFDGI